MLHLIFTVVFLINQLSITPTIFAQTSSPVPGDALQLEEFACNAYDPSSLRKCLQETNTTGSPLIKITAPIICKSRQDCAFEIKNINTSVNIRATSLDNKIWRSSDYGYTLFKIEGSSGFSFTDLVIEDQDPSPCLPGVICPSLITIKNSEDIRFDKVTFNKSHGTALDIADSRNITVNNSGFFDSIRTGLQITSRVFTEGLVIENNLFEDNGANALIFQAPALDNKSSRISKNKFTNNHAKGAYLNCTYPCTGSQVKINGPTVNLNFSQNIISGGTDTIFDTVGLYSSGVEVGNNNIANLSLFCNEVSQNRGSGIVQSPPFGNLASITISENKIWGNGLNLNIPIAKVEDNNCYNRECKLACLSTS